MDRVGPSRRFQRCHDAGVSAFAFIQIAPWRLVIVGVFLVTLAYFAVADWLYMARLAGYVCIAEMPDAPISSMPIPIPPAPDRTTIDRDETILSDIPNLALET